ncbi:glycosyltransferase [Plantactinospora veratri]
MAAVIRVLVDGRIDAPDGIGRYTRCTVAALRSADRIRLDVLAPTGTPRYGSAEADELLDAARRVDAEVIHLFDYRIPWPDPGIPLVVTVHDVVRLLDPGLCYSDPAFAARFGAADLAALRRAAAELRTLTPPAPAARARPASAHEEYYGLMMAHLAATAARIVVPTETVAGQFRANVRADAPLRVSSWGSDHLLAAPAPPDGAVPSLPEFVLYVGLARAHKRIGAVLDAYARTASRRRGVPLVLVGGDFAPGATGAEQVAEHAVGADAVLLGAVDDGVLQALYRRAGAVVSLSASEGFGFPPLEALAAGAPVVAADIPTYRELLGAAARLVDPDDVAATARAIDESVAAGPPRRRPVSLPGPGRRTGGRCCGSTGRRCRSGHGEGSGPARPGWWRTDGRRSALPVAGSTGRSGSCRPTPPGCSPGLVGSSARRLQRCRDVGRERRTDLPGS